MILRPHLFVNVIGGRPHCVDCVKPDAAASSAGPSQVEHESFHTNISDHVLWTLYDGEIPRNRLTGEMGGGCENIFELLFLCRIKDLCMTFDGASGGSMRGDIGDEFPEFVDVWSHLPKAFFVFF